MQFSNHEKEIWEKMFTKAKEALQNAYAPYSNFRVGAAIAASDGEIFGGCNVENASYRLTQCAEGAALTALVASGRRHIAAVLVMVPKEYNMAASPCGACRQMLREFATLDTKIYMCDDEKLLETKTLGELLPMSFGPEHLEGKK